MTVDEVVEVLARDEQFASLCGAMGIQSHDETCGHCLLRRDNFREWARERAAQIVTAHESEMAEARGVRLSECPEAVEKLRGWVPSYLDDDSATEKEQREWGRDLLRAAEDAAEKARTL